MPNINKVIIAGHITRDPEVRFTTKGLAIAGFSVAVNRKWKADGQEKEEVAFIDCTSFGKQGEMIGREFKKGSAIMIEGRLKTESWEDKQTQQKRSKLGVIVEQVHFLGGGKTGPNIHQEPAAAEKAAESPIGDDVPF